MIKLTEPNAVINQKLPDGTKGHMLRFDCDISLDSDFVIDLSYFSFLGQQIPFIARSVAINNTLNPDVLNMTVDSFLKYPHVAIAGQIVVAQLPNIENKTYIEFTTTKQATSTIVNIFISDYSMNPATFGSVGSSVFVTNTVGINVVDPALIVPADSINPPKGIPIIDMPFYYAGGNTYNRKRKPTTSLPLSGLSGSGYTQILAGNYRIFRIKLYISANASIASAGENLIDIRDGGGGGIVLVQAQPDVPGSEGTGIGGVEIIDWELDESGYAMVNGDLYVNITTALATGNLFGYLTYAPL